MTEPKFPKARRAVALAAVLCGLAAAAGVSAQVRERERNGDYIVAVINQELVTAFELNQRMSLAREDARRRNQRLPAAAEFVRGKIRSIVESFA